MRARREALKKIEWDFFKIRFFRRAVQFLFFVLVIALGSIVYFSRAHKHTVEWQAASIKGSKLTLSSPQLTAYSLGGRLYKIKASRAIKDLAQPNVINLFKLNALLPYNEGQTATLEAIKGDYNQQNKQLFLPEGGVLTLADGTIITISQGRVDFTNKGLSVKEGISIKGAGFELVAPSLETQDKGQSFFFSGGVHVTFNDRQ